MKYEFLISNYNEGEEVYYAVLKGTVETLILSSTYDRNGQVIGSSDAGDYLTLLTQNAVDFANQAYHNNHADFDDLEVSKKWAIGDDISAYDYSEFDEIVDSELEKDVDYLLEYTTCEGFDYWDGNNNKTIVTSSVMGGETHTLIDDEKLIQKLNEALENMSFVEENCGFREYEYENFKITKSAWQGDWESYSIVIE